MFKEMRETRTNFGAKVSKAPAQAEGGLQPESDDDEDLDDDEDGEDDDGDGAEVDEDDDDGSEHNF